MKRTVLAFILSAQAIITTAQSRNDYDAVVNKFQKFYNLKQPDSVFSLFADRIKGMMPLDKTTEMVGKLHEQFGEMQSNEFTKQDEHFTYYKTGFSKGTLILVVGLTKENKLQNFRFTPYQEDKPTTNDKATNNTEKPNIILKTATGNIYGTLALPGNGKKVPVVLIIAGSGPTDRNGNCAAMGLKGNTYKMIADSLQKAGIASVRYDKRGIGESAGAMKDEESISFNDMVNDATGFIGMLNKDPRFSKVTILGHSEGSLIGIIAAGKGKANAYISVAGLGERADRTLEKQIGVQSQELAEKATIILDSLDKGYTVKNIDPSLTSIFRPSVLPYMISWLKYDPQQEIRKLSIPVLILQGTTDIQVGMEEAAKLKKASPHATLKLVKGMNHILKQAPEDRQQNIATYSNPDLPLSPGFMPEIVKFIKGVK